nr:hypothetical protein [Tanacetum cinerariifolium]
MATLSEVSEYLNSLETLMDDGDSSKIRMGKIKTSEEELEMFKALEDKSDVVEVNKHKDMLGKLGFVRLDYGEYGRRMVKEAHVAIHGFNFLVNFVVIDCANEGEPSVRFGRDFLVTTKCKVDFSLGEMRIDLTMLE